MTDRNIIKPTSFGPVLINRHDNVVGRVISEYGDWEADYIRMLGNLLDGIYPKGSRLTIIDGGANIGMFTLGMAKLSNFVMEIHAIEPQRHVFQMLNANVALNSLNHVWTYQNVLGETSGDTLMVAMPDPDVGANFGAFEVLSPAHNSDCDVTAFLRPEPIRSLALDDLHLEACALLKLDVEGMELAALNGAKRLLAQSHPMLFFERHKTDYEGVKALLGGFGYALLELPERNVLGFPKAWQLSVDNFPRIDLG
ncbi:MAG: FkbM family methyltransferase [Sandarakinorhabdus sp.]|nr:FkbM family methyltransferase [Sandarakinorhabdus sp.]